MKIYIPTASCFSKIITSKGQPSGQREKYINELVDNAFGVFHGNVKTEWTKRGISLEEEAIRRNLDNNDCIWVDKLPFQISADGKSGCYVDGAIGDNGLLEVKCPSPSVHKTYLRSRFLPTTYFQQVQGELYITEREWCDFFSYCPNDKSFLVRANRDEKFISILEEIV